MKVIILGVLLLAGLIGSAASATETITYTYDANGRLIKVKSTGTVNNNQTRTICFDKAGNRVVYKSDSSGQSATCVTQG